MSTATKSKPAFKVPAATAAPISPEPAKSAGPKIERPFKPSDFCGFSDDDLRAVLTFHDIIDPDRMYSPRALADITGMSESQAFDLFNGRDSEGRSNIEDTRGFLGHHPCAYGYRVLEFLERRPDIKCDLNEFAIAGYRRGHPELFKEPPGGENLIERMRIDRARIESDRAAAEKAAAEAILYERWGRLAAIMSRYLCPTDQDVIEALDLAAELCLSETDLLAIWRWVQSVHRRQRRLDARRASGARIDPADSDLLRLRKSASTRPAFFESTSEYPYPRLRHPPTITD